MSTESAPLLVGSISGVIGIAIRLLQLLGDQSRHLSKKRELELFKLKCQIEVLRKEHSLQIPQILCPDDIDSLRASGLPWFDPGRVRDTFWFGIVRTWKPIFVFSLIGVLIFLALSCIAGALAILYTVVVENASGSELGILWLIFLVDLIVGPMLVTSAVRLIVALRASSVGQDRPRTAPAPVESGQGDHGREC